MCDTDNEAGADSAAIQECVEKLAAHGWSVDLFCFSIPEFTTLVDFDKKTIQHNNSKASYTRNAFERICIAEEFRAIGAYRYEFVDGEKLPNDDGTFFRYLCLRVTPIERV